MFLTKIFKVIQLINKIRKKVISVDVEKLLPAFPGDSDGNEIFLLCGRPGFNPLVGRFTGEGNGNPLQYSYLEGSMTRRVGWARVHIIKRILLSKC